MNVETKVGAFVLIASVIAGLAIMRLGDIRFENRYALYFIFDDVGELRNQSLVKVSGVEVGHVKKIELEQGRARIEAHIKKSVPVYQDAVVKVKQPGLIGTQYLDLDPGTPQAQRLRDGDTLYGSPSKSFGQIMEKISDLFEGKNGKAGFGNDLQATMSNLRSITDSLNSAIGLQRTELKDIVKNLHQFSVDLKGIASDLHEVTTAKKEDVAVAITKLRSLMERLDEIVAKVQRGEGSVGKLLADKEMGDDVKKTVSNLKETSESAKEVLARFVKVRSFWEAQLRVVPGANSARADGGIRLQPRPGKYYLFGVSNVGDRKNEYEEPGDYEKKNTITAVLGKEFGPVGLEIGAIRSSAGIGLRYYPFEPYITEDAPAAKRWARNLELFTQVFDVTRDEVRGRAGHERLLDTPQVNIGAKYRVNRWTKLGIGVEDMMEVRQYSVITHLIFEDRDLAYLFGFVSFAR